MIFPHPETDLSLSVLVLGSELIADNKNMVLIDDALMSFLKKDKRRSPELFLDTLTFLHTLEIVELKGYKIKFLKNDHTQTSIF